MVFVRLLLTGSVPTYSIAVNMCSTMGLHHRFVVSSARSRRVRCWGHYYSCSTRQMLVSWLPVSAGHLISMPTTRNSIRGAILHLMDCSGTGWSWELSGSRSGCDLIDSNSEKTEFLWCATSRRCPHLDTGELSVCGSLIHSVTVVRNLGVMLQSDLSM